MTTKHDEYIKQLKEVLGKQKLKVISEANDLFIVQNENNSTFKLQLICSEVIDIEAHGSHNGNIVLGIGVFSFEWTNTDNIPEYFVLVFENLIDNTFEFVVIAASELIRRLKARKRIADNNVYFWLWLMDDRKVYETTNISLEGEWYFLSKGYARVADEKGMDYSNFLNNWRVFERKNF